MTTNSTHKYAGLNDRYNRHINYLRISITDRCNLKCLYCRPSGKIDKLSHDDILRYEEILRIIHIFSEMGLTKIRITGGEPLVRKGVYDFLKKLPLVPGIKDVSLTTNGVFLAENILKIKNCGIRRLNISLDSLEREKFFHLTGYDKFNQVWKGIERAYELGFNPIKINVVALRGINEKEIPKFAELAFIYPFHIRFIEHMPIGISAVKADNPILSNEIKTLLSDVGNLEPIINGEFDGPAKRYKIRGAKGEIGIISPISHHFCNSCNRLRLTADGHLRPCLLSDYFEDLKTPLRSGCSNNELIDIILRTIKNKPSRHNFSTEKGLTVKSQMSSIGG